MNNPYPSCPNFNVLHCGSRTKEGEALERNLGGNCYFGDTLTFCPEIYNYLMQRFCVRSVLDVGSGRGFIPAYLHKNFNVPVIGIDGLSFNVETAVYPLVQHDLTKGSFKTSPVDLVTCVEVVEHIKEEYMDNLLDTLTQGQVLFMTHALPGTNGVYHVNEQTDEYWVNKLAARNFGILPVDTRIVRALGVNPIFNHKYYIESALVFGRIPLTGDLNNG